MPRISKQPVLCLISVLCGACYFAAGQGEDVFPGKKCTMLGNCPSETVGFTVRGTNCYFCTRSLPYGNCDADGPICYLWTWGTGQDCGVKGYGWIDSFGACNPIGYILVDGQTVRCPNTSCT